MRNVANHRRRSHLANAEKTLTVAQWHEILDFFGYACAYCLATDRPLTQDHVIAVERGGGYVYENIVPACGSCNSRKKDQPVWVTAGWAVELQPSFSSYEPGRTDPRTEEPSCFA